ncbi:hypothetical protein B6U70_02640 [Euryarchaeota archaeon ex4484_162]|nr:MAG: hypothetical protein B6U70_02640 [Euryarchaeota archaeon ex4484_162]
MGENREPANPWTADDEKEHFPSLMEWWCAEVFFKTLEDNKKWSLKASFTEWRKKKTVDAIGSIFNMTLFDQDSDKYLIYCARNESEKLISDPDCFYIQYGDSFIKGLYPHYQMRFLDLENHVDIKLIYRGQALPHWVAQDITNGFLPMGLGFYRYGFIPKCEVSGTMNIKNKKFKVKGLGYFEHVWGDFSYRNPLSNPSAFKKTVSTYAKLAGWWIHHHRPSIPKTIAFSTENNPLGYDWIWALFNNGWTIFYGNILFWITEGPIAGSLILSKDGKNYTEFCNVSFRYNKVRYVKEYDFYYPSEIEMHASHGMEKLSLTSRMTVKSREYISEFPHKGYWLGLAICEAPGEIKGHYFDGRKKIKLDGICKIEAQRQISTLGHNSLRLEFLRPPKGVGISMRLKTHFFKKNLTASLQLAPTPNIRFNIHKIKNQN